MKFTDRLRLAASVMQNKPTASAGWSPRTGAKGYHLFDGSKFKGANIYPSSFLLDSASLREKSRLAFWDSTQARALINRIVDNTIGTGLSLEANPMWNFIGGNRDEKQKHDTARDIENRFHLWANSKDVDSAGKYTFYDFQSMILLNLLRDGECFLILRYVTDPRRVSPVAIQAILPEQVDTPREMELKNAAAARNNKIVEGIELDAMGKEVAIYVIDEKRKATRIPVMGTESGRVFVIHPVLRETMGAVRGVPILAPIVHELQKITDGTVAELEAMVLNAILAVWVKPSTERNASDVFKGVRVNEQNTSAALDADQGVKQTTFDKPGLVVQSLKAGEELQSFDTKRPNINFPSFIKQITGHLSASLSVPIEILEMQFTNSYSASRAALLMFWKTIDIRRAQFASQFLNPIYEAWFTEEVKAKRISAQGFDNGTPLARRAWLNCAWNGDRLPSIDPLKEANADAERIAQGATTRERVALEYNGSDIMENIARLNVENEALAAANSHLEPRPINTTPEETNG